MSGIRELYEKFGVSPWLDNLSRDMLISGELKQLIDQGIHGVTSNPSIFEKAFATDTYQADLDKLRQAGLDREQAYWELAAEDIQNACDLLTPVYKDSNKNDGFVSLEVSPKFARNPDKTVEQAHTLWQKVSRPNLMIKVPATVECLPAISELISQNINVNVTLIFSLPRYLQVINAYMIGLEKCQDPSLVRSVASFFVSRVDTMIDPLLPSKSEHKGRAALAQAQAAYGIYLESFNQLGMRWLSLKSRGAVEQKPLWASTSTKDPNFPPLMYVSGLLATGSVNTLPSSTVQALLDDKSLNGCSPISIEVIEAAHETLSNLAKENIDMASVSANLEKEGLEKFSQAFDSMLANLSY